MQKDKINVKLSLSYEEATTYLEDLLKSLKSGKIVVQNEEEFVSLEPGERVNVKLSAKVKKDTNKFEFEMSWATAEDSKSVKITSKEPAVKASSEVARKQDSTPATKQAAIPAKKPAAKKPAAKKTASKKTAPKKASIKKGVKPATQKPGETKTPVKPASKTETKPAAEATPKRAAVKPKTAPLSRPTTTGTKP